MASYVLAGPYRLFWRSPVGSTDIYLGCTGPEGVTSTRDQRVEDIVCDQLGPATVMDGVYQGGNVTLSFILQEAKRKAVRGFLSPFNEQYDASMDTGYPERIGVIGSLASDYAGLLTLVPLSGTPASTGVAGNNNRAYRGIPIGPIVEYLDARPRFIPVTFQAYPQNVGTDANPLWKWWDWVAAPSSPSYAWDAIP